ncbi:hypothetical protein K461DRAFT_321771 [Myriangium duriaei CBS 260.36]|uniref:Uncharacterized protein n=1 Tax=Myriangium duriaei CBS 260.36 TaxID=1168546 RepID=A0A9P4IX58_9PEZI|nr:hypothetical protein K461DRAFT_321771 [Myriangium duriaei CBS 260.36]
MYLSPAIITLALAVATTQAAPVDDKSPKQCKIVYKHAFKTQLFSMFGPPPQENTGSLTFYNPENPSGTSFSDYTHKVGDQTQDYHNKKLIWSNNPDKKSCSVAFNGKKTIGQVKTCSDVAPVPGDKNKKMPKGTPKGGSRSGGGRGGGRGRVKRQVGWCAMCEVDFGC